MSRVVGNGDNDRRVGRREKNKAEYSRLVCYVQTSAGTGVKASAGDNRLYLGVVGTASAIRLARSRCGRRLAA